MRIVSSFLVTLAGSVAENFREPLMSSSGSVDVWVRIDGALRQLESGVSRHALARVSKISVNVFWRELGVRLGEALMTCARAHRM